MSQFAKLYGPPADQVLVMLDADRDGSPRVRVIVQAPEGGLMVASNVFDPNASGLLAARLHFQALNETSARHTVARVLEEQIA